MALKSRDNSRFISKGLFQYVWEVEKQKRPVVTSLSRDFIIIGESQPSLAKAVKALTELRRTIVW